MNTYAGCIIGGKMKGKSQTCETTDWDPRYERAQSIEGAKAQYVDIESYTILHLEKDVERLLELGENPDKGPIFGGREVLK